MAGTTTNFAIPYPSITDYVTDGATAMKSIADKVDDVLFAEVANNNLIINGAMQVTQRSAVGTAVASITTSGYYTADRWYSGISSLGTWSQTTIADAPTGSGFRNSIKMDCTTADASPAASDYVAIIQRIEGQNLQAIRKGTASAKKITLSFWVKAFQTGIYIVNLYDYNNNREISKSYNVLASNTWEYKTISFPADTTGAFTNDNATGLEVGWYLGAGSNFTSGTLNTTWNAANAANRLVGQTNVASAVTGEWFMTGASLTVGDVDVPFQFKSFADDLRDCSRYFERMIDAQFGNMMSGYSGFNGAVYVAVMKIRTTQRMRATVSVVASTTGAVYNTANQTSYAVSSWAFFTQGNQGFQANSNAAVAAANGNVIQGDGFVFDVSAEL